MEGKVLLQDLAQSLATKRNIQRKDAEIFLKTFFEIIGEAILQDKIVKIKGLGTFKMIEVQERESVNVNTGERIVIPGHSKISFTPDAELKDKVNKPFALFQTVIINEGTSLEDMENKESLELIVDSVEVTDESPEETPEMHDVPEEPVVLDIPEEPVEPLFIESTVPEESEDDQATTLNNQLSTTNEPKWWHISVAMLALLFAFFWIVLLIGYFVGKNNGVSLEQLINRPVQEPVVKVDTIYVEKTVEPDTIYIQVPENSKTITSQKAVKPVTKPVAAKENGPVAYEIVGQKGVRTIKWGDYLLKIVRQEYGNEDALKYVISYNKFADPNNLPVGTEVKLPKLKEK